ncbi:unnamed protein product [Vicia faba]|uniref:Uncharacterized protein n=1 Tax=Vicia faba TaxID=3906 RepID=A0AAV1AQD5_VICFA|nr:unnamed protein product [Vicia faba]
MILCYFNENLIAQDERPNVFYVKLLLSFNSCCMTDSFHIMSCVQHYIILTWYFYRIRDVYICEYGYGFKMFICVNEVLSKVVNVLGHESNVMIKCLCGSSFQCFRILVQYFDKMLCELSY